jgi:uncharacterized membrane protein
MKTALTEQKAEFISAIVVRLLVFAAALLGLAGGMVYLSQCGRMTPNYHLFHIGLSELRSPHGIMMNALKFDVRGVIQLGILLLIAIPILRVAVFALTFILQKDWLYFAVTLIVFCILMFSLLGNNL